jgi:hypothetical protein
MYFSNSNFCRIALLKNVKITVHQKYMTHHQLLKSVHGQNISGQNVSATKHICDKTYYYRQTRITDKRIETKRIGRQNEFGANISRHNVLANKKYLRRLCTTPSVTA